MSRRAVIVDDMDPSIHYIGNSWKVDQGSLDKIGNFGPPFRSTLHGTDSSASLSLQFSGTSIKVYGSNNIRNDSGTLDPKWECFIDQQSIGASDPFQFAENNWQFCKSRQLQDGLHTLTINVTIAKKQTFWLDRIEYIPSATMSVEHSDILIENNDPGLRYGQGWRSFNNTNMTQKKGALLEFQFTGVSTSWYSWTIHEYPGNATSGSYRIDGSSPQKFNINGHREGVTTTFYNQKLFETPTLPMGSHKLSVTYDGNRKTSPLTLDYLIVQNGTAPPSNNAGSHETISAKKSNLGAIVGGAIAATCFVCLIFVVIIFLRQRRRHHGDNTSLLQVKSFLNLSGGQSSYGAWPTANADDRYQMSSDYDFTSSRNPPTVSLDNFTNGSSFENIRESWKAEHAIDKTST
ncbi:hypothetical protein CPB83DRAFT_907035 [Crepidotus variabilis]|uniref:Uncharacterized protein n=1 Tax=Crepidotus variabilis TaxID=179855 RepID=A0A9P6EG29_9AGAR|nr:hypothetical protein CPB83DRAFT_907035 [Crepidotus variabilis]